MSTEVVLTVMRMPNDPAIIGATVRFDDPRPDRAGFHTSATPLPLPEARRLARFIQRRAGAEGVSVRDPMQLLRRGKARQRPS